MYATNDKNYIKIYKEKKNWTHMYLLRFCFFLRYIRADLTTIYKFFKVNEANVEKNEIEYFKFLMDKLRFGRKIVYFNEDLLQYISDSTSTLKNLQSKYKNIVFTINHRQLQHQIESIMVKHLQISHIDCHNFEKNVSTIFSNIYSQIDNLSEHVVHTNYIYNIYNLYLYLYNLYTLDYKYKLECQYFIHERGYKPNNDYSYLFSCHTTDVELLGREVRNEIHNTVINKRYTENTNYFDRVKTQLYLLYDIFKPFDIKYHIQITTDNIYCDTQESYNFRYNAKRCGLFGRYDEFMGSILYNFTNMNDSFNMDAPESIITQKIQKCVIQGTNTYYYLRYDYFYHSYTFNDFQNDIKKLVKC